MISKPTQAQKVSYARPYTRPCIPEAVTQGGGGDDVGKRRGRLCQTRHCLRCDLVNNHGNKHNQPYVEDAVTGCQNAASVKEHRSGAPWS